MPISQERMDQINTWASISMQRLGLDMLVAQLPTGDVGVWTPEGGKFAATVHQSGNSLVVTRQHRRKSKLVLP